MREEAFDLVDKIRETDDVRLTHHTEEAQVFMQRLEDLMEIAPNELKTDKEFMIEMIKANLNCTKYLSEELREDLDVQMAVFDKFNEYTIEDITNSFGYIGRDKIGIPEVNVAETDINYLEKDGSSKVLEEEKIGIKMDVVYQVIDEHDFKKEERYPSWVKYLEKTYSRDYEEPDKLVNLNIKNIGVKDVYVPKTIEEGIIFEPGRAPDFGDDKLYSNPFGVGKDVFESDLKEIYKSDVYNETFSFLKKTNYEDIYGYDLGAVKQLDTESIGRFCKDRYSEIENIGIDSFKEDLIYSNLEKVTEKEKQAEVQL